jgi:hypothetical protein
MKGRGRHIPRGFALAGLWTLIAFTATACATPRMDRNWTPYLANATHIERLDDKIAIHPMSDWTYDAKGPIGQHYGETVIDPAQIRGAWFLVEPQPGSTIAAHTLILFELTDDRLIGLTIEARREVNEEYSAWRGIWNAYELSYLWATPRDLLTRRAVMLGHEIYVYPLSISDKQALGLFDRLIDRTHALETKPRFYNTLSSNCTNELGKAAGLRWNVAFVLTGLSAEHLFRQGLIAGPSYKALKARADVTTFVKALNDKGLDDAAFDKALLTELRAREGIEAPSSP